MCSMGWTQKINAFSFKNAILLMRNLYLCAILRITKCSTSWNLSALAKNSPKILERFKTKNFGNFNEQTWKFMFKQNRQKLIQCHFS